MKCSPSSRVMDWTEISSQLARRAARLVVQATQHDVGDGKSHATGNPLSGASV